MKTTMKKRKRHEIEDADIDELTAVFVDTSLDTHVAILVSPLISFSRLKEQIVKEHSKFFPDFGEIKINALKVKRDGKFYHLSESILLRIAFHGIESWFVFADVTRTPFDNRPQAHPITVQKLQSNLVNCGPVSNNQIPNSSSKNFEDKAVEIGLNISILEASEQQKKKKKRKCKSLAITLDDLASSRPIENILKLERTNAVEQSLLETKGSDYLFDGGASEQKRLVVKKDDPPKDETGASNVVPSKVVESSAGSQSRKKERSDGKPDTSHHVHDASFVSTDAPWKTDKLKGTHGLLGQPEGSFLNQERVVYNAEGVSASLVRKSKKRKKSGDKSHAAKLGEGPDTMRKDGVAFDNEKITMDRELDGMSKLTDDSKLLSSQGEGALYSVEKAGVNEEVVAPLKSVELKLTDSGNTSKKTKLGKKTKKPSEKDVYDTINGRNGVQQCLVADSMHNGVTSLISETTMCGRESDNKTNDEEEVKESGETKGLMPVFEGEINQKDDLSALDGFPAKAVQSSTVSETTKKDRRSVDLDTTCQSHDVSSVSTDAPTKTVTAEGTPELIGQLNGTGKNSAGLVNLENFDHSAEATSGPRAKMSKKRKKSGVDGVDKIHTVKLDEGSDIMRKDVAALDNEKFTFERKLGGTGSLEGSTPLKLTNESQLLLSQPEAALCSVESAQVKFKDVAPLKSLELKITESENTSRKKKSSKKSKKANENNGGRATQLGHMPDFVQDSATFICERESENKRTGDMETNESGETNVFYEGGVPRKDDKRKDVVAASNVWSSEVFESSTASDKTNKERMYHDRNTTGDDAPEKTFAAKGTPELLGQLEGTSKILDDSLNQESLVHNAEAISGSRLKMSNKIKKVGVDRVDKIRPSKLDEGSDIIRKDVAAFDHEKNTLERKLGGTNSPEMSTPLKPSNDSQLLLSQCDAPLCSVESAQETFSEKTSTKRKPSKKTKKSNENNGTHATQLGRVPDIMHDSAIALDSETFMCESPSDNKRTGDLEIKESGESEGFFEAGVRRKDDQRKDVAAVSNVLPSKVAESSTASETTKKERIYDAYDASSGPTDAPEKTITAKGTPELLCQLEGSILNQESVIHNPEAISGSRVKRTKKKKKGGGDGDEKIPASKLGEGTEIRRKDVASFNCEKITIERELDGINISEGGTPLKQTEKINNVVQEQMRVIGVESIQPPEVTKEISNKPKKKHAAFENNLSNLPINQLAIKTQEMVVEQADDVMLNSNIKDTENQENVLLHKKRHNGLTEVNKLDKPASKVKAKKRNLSSSVDTSCSGHNLSTSEKIEENVRVGSKLQNDDHESEPLSQVGTIPLEVLETHPISQHEERLDIQNVTKKKAMKKKPNISANGPDELAQPDVLKTTANGIAEKANKGLSLPEEHYNDPNVIVSQEISSGSKEMTKPQKLPASKQKVKNLVQPSSVDAESKKENLTASNKKSEAGKNSMVQKSIIQSDHGRKHQSTTKQSPRSKEEMATEVSIGGPVNSQARALGQNGSKASGTLSLISGISPKTNLPGKNTKEVPKKNSQELDFRTPSIKKQPVSALPQKKSVSAKSGVLFGDLSSDSSDDEVERGGSSNSTRTPDDLSSSDYSEGESKGEVVTSPQNSEGGGSARDKTNFNLSALKNMDLESVLRSSRRYKKAKLVASQSQLEDGNSEPPEFVPDSQA